MSESQHQAALFRWARMNEQRYPELRLLAFHVPNGGARAKATAWRLREEGVKAGVADVLLLVPRGLYHGLAIELKNPKPRGVVSLEQRLWLSALQEQGYCCTVCWGWEAAVAEIQAYFALPKPPKESP